MNYRLLKNNIYNREKYILNCAKGKTVLHLGAAQANDRNDWSLFKAHVKSDRFLHRRICDVAKQCVGVDYNRGMIEKLNAEFGVGEIVYGDLENADSLHNIKGTYDLIVMGELIEHLANPCAALKNITRFMADDSVLLITTPNALGVSNFLFTMLGFEAHDEDHVAIYTPRLLESILNRSGLRLEEYSYYQSTFDGGENGVFPNYWQRGATSLRSIFGKLAINVFLRVHPAFSDGIILTCRQARSTNA